MANQIDDVALNEAILEQVAPENRDLFREIFMDDDSEDEFEGFELDNESDDGESSETTEDKVGPARWSMGNCEPTMLQFKGESGIKITLDDESEPIDYFKLFIDDDVMKIMYTETNRYAQQYLEGKELSRFSRYAQWTPVSQDEMKAFLGLIIAMGLVQQLDIQDYWSTDEVISTPFFPRVMSRNRFLNILTFFHLTDNARQNPRGDPNYDPIFKIRPFYSHLQQKCEFNYVPEENLALDEAMVAWRGNLSFRVYNPDKPDKFGIKLYEICDSKSGYCSRFEMYTGKTQPSAKGATYDLVMPLMNPYLDKGYKLYVDNYYTSPILFQDLYDRKTGACGTLRSNRKGVPVAIKQSKLKKGESIMMNNGDLLVIKWHDKRDVLMLTSIHSGDMMPTGKNDVRTGEAITKPKPIIFYNKNMGAVDRNDQMLQYQAFRRRTLKWWKKVFFHLLMLACLNAYILYKIHRQSNNKKVILQRVFRRKLVQQLLLQRETVGKPSAGRQAPNAGNISRLQERHFPSKVPPTEKKQNPARLCVVCTTTTGKRKTAGDGRRRKESTYQCTECDVGLCVTPCFQLYHTHKEYKLAFQRQRQGRDPEDGE